MEYWYVVKMDNFKNYDITITTIIIDCEIKKIEKLSTDSYRF